MSDKVLCAGRIARAWGRHIASLAHKDRLLNEVQLAQQRASAPLLDKQRLLGDPHRSRAVRSSSIAMSASSQQSALLSTARLKRRSWPAVMQPSEDAVSQIAPKQAQGSGGLERALCAGRGVLAQRQQAAERQLRRALKSGSPSILRSASYPSITEHPDLQWSWQFMNISWRAKAAPQLCTGEMDMPWVASTLWMTRHQYI